MTAYSFDIEEVKTTPPSDAPRQFAALFGRRPPKRKRKRTLRDMWSLVGRARGKP